MIYIYICLKVISGNIERVNIGLIPVHHNNGAVNFIISFTLKCRQKVTACELISKSSFNRGWDRGVTVLNQFQRVLLTKGGTGGYSVESFSKSSFNKGWVRGCSYEIEAVLEGKFVDIILYREEEIM